MQKTIRIRNQFKTIETSELHHDSKCCCCKKTNIKNRKVIFILSDFKENFYLGFKLICINCFTHILKRHQYFNSKNEFYLYLQMMKNRHK